VFVNCKALPLASKLLVWLAIHAGWDLSEVSKKSTDVCWAVAVAVALMIPYGFEKKI
jgi:hypothetical protein